ncbi:MAG: prepilin peptidase [Thermoplasmata archaeon]|nr:prepilin peptidase [Thermoplasmata archaeon]
MSFPFAPASLGALVLVVGLGYASWLDWTEREVEDELWAGLGIIGAVLGAVAFVPATPMALGLWALTSVFVLEHFLPWDLAVEKWNADAPGWIEAGAYGGVALLVGGLAYVDGIGNSGVPTPVLAVLLSVYLARGLFEAGVLWGGADAKAVMAAALVLPFAPTAIFSALAGSSAALAPLPFGWVLVMNGALLAIAIPIAITLRNIARGTFEFPRGITQYPVPVVSLPDLFVWVKDPFLDRSVEDAESSEDDRAIRIRQKIELESKGITTVWVTPQIPFVVLLWGGALATFLVGNILFAILGAL